MKSQDIIKVVLTWLSTFCRIQLHASHNPLSAQYRFRLLSIAVYSYANVSFQLIFFQLFGIVWNVKNIEKLNNNNNNNDNTKIPNSSFSDKQIV